ncbi:MAG: membrane dipeptidase [Betaproteobacteria bacterium]|nr:membrane dipeptidase [Betaproteobacteria bacterium]
MDDITSNIELKALRLHQESTVLDALTPYYTLDEPYTTGLLKGGVSAAFLSVVSPASWEDTLRRTETALRKIERSPVLTLATTAADLRTAKQQNKIAMVLITQGADMIEKDLQRVGIMFRLGFRVIGLCYTFSNQFGSGCGELGDGGVTFLGRDLITTINEFPMMLDVSHAGHRTSFEAVQLARSPVVTHANAYTVTPMDRNKKDEVLSIVAQKKGVIGLNALPRAIAATNPTLDLLLNHADYITGKFGMRCMGLGLDYIEAHKQQGEALPQSQRNRTLRPDIFGTVDDYFTQDYPKDLETIEKLPNLTGALLRRGYGEENVRLILGENWVRAFESNVG